MSVMLYATHCYFDTYIVRALGSGKSSNSSQLKLVKRDGRPCLCFETKAHESALSIDITHDIPIKVDYKLKCSNVCMCVCVYMQISIVFLMYYTVV